MYVEGELELLAGHLWQLGELAKFVDAEPVCAAAMFDRPKRPTPGADAGKRPRSSVSGRPQVEDNRLPGRDPLEAARGDSASGAADVLANGHEVVMSGKRVVEAQLTPHLRETGVDIEIDPSTGCRQHLLVIEIAGDVDHEVRFTHAPQHLGAGKAGHRPSIAPLQQIACSVQAEGRHDLSEVSEIC